MKKSEEINEKLSEEDNDLKVMGLMNQKLREERKERFEEEWLPKLIKVCEIQHEPDKGRYVIQTMDLGWGIIDFYPKANKLLIRKKTKWIKPGLKWLVTNIINKKSK